MFWDKKVFGSLLRLCAVILALPWSHENVMFVSLQNTSDRHPGLDLLYEHHSNQSGDPDNVLVHCLGHWRMTRLFHDLIFHPKITVSEKH